MYPQITSVIIDDEIFAAKNLELLLTNYCPEVLNLGIAHTLKEGVKLIKTEKPQIVFLDISLSSVETGFDLLDLFPQKEFHVVFVTAFSDFGIEAIKRKAFDYILKPLDFKEIIKTVDDIISLEKTINKPLNKQLIAIPALDGTHLVASDNILFCEADGSYTVFHLTDDKKITLSRSIKNAEGLLGSSSFSRVHRSYIINLNKVTKLHFNDGGYAEVNKKLIPVSKNYMEKLKSVYIKR